MYGNKPYDKNIMPVENIAVSVAAMGEGFHNYHVSWKAFKACDSLLMLLWLSSMFSHSIIELVSLVAGKAINTT